MSHEECGDLCGFHAVVVCEEGISEYGFVVCLCVRDIMWH